MTASFSRRTLLLGGAALGTGLALAGCASGAPLIRPTVPPDGTVRERLAALMAGYAENTDLLGLSLRDRRTGASYAFRGDYATQSASIAKVMIVLLALRKARAEGTELTFERYTEASQAIINSANDAADSLWEWVGGKDAYTALAADLGLAHTHGDDRSDFWSWTHTTPDDQRALIDALVDGSPVLAVDDRLYLLDLMSKTNSSQTWGVGHPRGGDVRVQMKNGWVQFASLDNLWAVNTIGHVSGEGRDYTAAVMCRRPSFAEGRALVDAIGADLFTVMGSGSLV